MKFLVIGKVRGMCCDYGWGTRGNTQYEIIHASSIEEAKKQVLDDETFGDLSKDRNEHRGESLIIYAISEEFNFDLKALQAQDAAETQAWREHKQREADEHELARLQEKLGKKK